MYKTVYFECIIAIVLHLYVLCAMEPVLHERELEEQDVDTNILASHLDAGAGYHTILTGVKHHLWLLKELQNLILMKHLS